MFASFTKCSAVENSEISLFRIRCFIHSNKCNFFSVFTQIAYIVYRACMQIK